MCRRVTMNSKDNDVDVQREFVGLGCQWAVILLVLGIQDMLRVTA
jgi:hypothetical protein